MLEYVLIILIFGVFYLLVVPVVSIWFTGRALFLRNAVGDDRDRDMDMVKVSSDWSRSSNCSTTSARPCLSSSSAVDSSHLIEAPG